MEFNLVLNHKCDFKMDLHERSVQIRIEITRRSQLEPFRNHTIVRVFCIAPAGLLQIAEPEMPLHSALNMQNDVVQ